MAAALALGLGLGLGLMGAATAQAAPEAPPTELVVRVGGFLGPTHVVELGPTAVVCATWRHGQKLTQTTVQPTPAQWALWRAQLAALHVDRWQKDYFNPKVLDGTQWLVRIVGPGLNVESSGSNSYPQADGQANGSPEQTEAFQRFRASFLTLGPACVL
jgi:hypothetical protein